MGASHDAKVSIFPGSRKYPREKVARGYPDSRTRLKTRKALAVVWAANRSKETP